MSVCLHRIGTVSAFTGDVQWTMQEGSDFPAVCLGRFPDTVSLLRLVGWCGVRRGILHTWSDSVPEEVTLQWRNGFLLRGLFARRTGRDEVRSVEIGKGLLNGLDGANVASME